MAAHPCGETRYLAPMRLRATPCLPVLLLACGAPSGGDGLTSVSASISGAEVNSSMSEETGSSGASTGAGASTGTSTSTAGDTSTSDGTTGTGSTSDASSETGEPLPPALKCSYSATPAGPLELMVPKGSAKRLEFTAPGLPDPSLVVAATLRFVSYDADHPGEEGEIFLNNGAAIELPADAAWENLEHASEVDVTGLTVAGDNAVSFGAGSFVDGTFYRIGQVALALEAHVEACPAAPVDPPKPVQISYVDATYTKAHNWVLRCDYDEGYAFTAKGDQATLDCSGLYDPDGTRTGTATFTFENLPAATYEITIKSRHSTNRNPLGALFVVAGEGKRVFQLEGDMVVDTWGTKALSGTVEVVLDSDMDSASDSVTWVRLEPV